MRRAMVVVTGRPALLVVAGLCVVAASVPLPARSATADIVRHARPVRSVFYVAKSENKNQVHYGVHVDDACRPKGKQPVYGYWRDLEEGPRVTSPLLSHEQSAYGVTRPRAIKIDERGGRVLFGLRGFPDRAITVQTFKSDVGCRAWAMTPIHKTPSVLQSIYVELGFLFSIDYVVVRGVSIANGARVQEKVED